MNIQTTFNGLMRIASTLAVLGLAVYVWGQYFEKPYLTYKNLPFPSFTEQAKPGELVQIRVERCSTSNKPEKYRMTRTMRNEVTREVSILPPIEVGIAPGCHRANSKLHFVPPSTPPGIYTLWGISTVGGYLRTHQIIWYSEPFEVLEGK